MKRFNVVSNGKYDMEEATDGMWVMFDDIPSTPPAVQALTDEQKDRVLSDVVELLGKQHDWLTKVAAINLVAGLYGRAGAVLAAGAAAQGGEHG